VRRSFSKLLPPRPPKPHQSVEEEGPEEIDPGEIEPKEVDLSEIEPEQVVPSRSSERVVKSEDMARRTLVSARLFYWLMADITLIIGGAWWALLQGFPVGDIERVIFSLVVLVSVFASPLMHFFFRDTR
jgi:hypothetical protein